MQGEVAYSGILRRGVAHLAHVLRAATLLVAWLVAPACAADVPSAWPGTIEAVRSDWSASAPPASGWVELRLPDDWNARWPGFDGVVWYRLRWQQAAPLDDVALYLEYLTLAGEIRVNGELVDRDPQLVEPLSRMWNVPRYFRLPPALLHAGENELLVRVSGFGAYASGLGPVHIGSAEPMRELFDSARIARQRLNLISFGIILSVGLLFLLLWLFRRQETAYGWFAAQQLAWAPIAWNTIATNPWPFTSTDAYQAFDMAGMLLFGASWTMFVLRFCERRWPRREAILWCVVSLAAASMFLAPHAHVREVRDLQVLLAVVLMFSADFMFLWFVWPGGRTDQRVLSICALISLIAGTHDALVLFGIIDSNTYYASLSNQLTVIGVAMVLAWNFVRNLHRIEGFNRELLQNVEEARTELAATLNRQHELELVHARLGERVNLAHDLHDGLGGMLIGNIAAMEQAPNAQLPSRAVLGMLQE
ncbi:MAG: 7TM diverse intracellular signaling domain-containing protein, partial [Dokdonella sp.]